MQLLKSIAAVALAASVTMAGAVDGLISLNCPVVVKNHHGPGASAGQAARRGHFSRIHHAAGAAIKAAFSYRTSSWHQTQELRHITPAAQTTATNSQHLP